MIVGFIVGLLVIGAFLIGLGAVITKVMNSIDEEEKEDEDEGLGY